MSALLLRIVSLLSLAVFLTVAAHRPHPDSFGHADADHHCCLCHTASISVAPSVEPPVAPTQPVFVESPVPETAHRLTPASPEATRGPPSA